MRHAIVVQHEPEVSQAAQAKLAEWGVGAEIVSSEIEAWRRICKLPTLDAVFVDITSEQNPFGFEVARFARQVIPQISIIYLARDVDGSFVSAASLANGEFVEVPFSAALVAMVPALTPTLEPA